MVFHLVDANISNIDFEFLIWIDVTPNFFGLMVLGVDSRFGHWQQWEISETFVFYIFVLLSLFTIK